MAKIGGFFPGILSDIICVKGNLNAGYAKGYTHLLPGERIGEKWKKHSYNKSFPHIPQVFPQGAKIGAIYISVDIKHFDKIELFSPFFGTGKMPKRVFFRKKFPIDKGFLPFADRKIKSCRKNFKKGIDFPEKKGYNG
jgi:hypothetical protein